MENNLSNFLIRCCIPNGKERIIPHWRGKNKMTHKVLLLEYWLIYSHIPFFGQPFLSMEKKGKTKPKPNKNPKNNKMKKQTNYPSK